VAVQASTLGANHNNCGCRRKRAWMRAIVQRYSGASHTWRTNESAGVDGKAQRAFGRGREVGARTVGMDCQAHT
jgi:hypothetical protein